MPVHCEELRQTQGLVAWHKALNEDPAATKKLRDMNQLKSSTIDKYSENMENYKTVFGTDDTGNLNDERQ
jgi:hypothetical protein